MSAEIAATSFFMKGIDKLIEKVKSKDIQSVKVVTIPFKSGKSIVKRATSTNTSKQDKPDIEITNPLKNDNRIIAITIIPDGTMKTNGLLKLQIEDVTVLEIETAGDLTDLNNLPLSIPNEGWAIKPQEKVKLFLWASSGTVAATLIVHFQRD